MKTFAQQRGQQAEQAAELWLKKQNLTFVTRNYRCRHGEIDLIMRENNVLVFVEVRFREEHTHGHPLETISPSKQRKLIKTAMHYLVAQRLWEKVSCRFDVIAPTSKNKDFMWIKNAFSVK